MKYTVFWTAPTGVYGKVMAPAYGVEASKDELRDSEMTVTVKAKTFRLP